MADPIIRKMHSFRLLGPSLALLFASGCASYGVIVNDTIPTTEPEKEPSIAHSIGAVTGVQLHRYNIATLELVENAFGEWTDELSTTEFSIEPYFIEFSFENLQSPEAKLFFNKVPTSFKLSDEQVDKLIAAERQLLREQPDFQRLLADLDKP